MVSTSSPNHEGESEEGVDSSVIDAAVQSAATRKQRQKNSSKCDIRHGGPLRAGLRSQRKPSNGEEAWLKECEALYSRLPKHSKYAQHKLRVLSKAMELLRRARTSRTQEEADELMGLLHTLKIGQHSAAAARPPGAAAAGSADAAMDS